MVDKKGKKISELNFLDLSIQKIENDLKHFKNSLNWLSIDEKNEKLEEMEWVILTCSDNLELLEKNTVEESKKKELNKLKAKVDKIKREYDSLKKSIINDSKKELSSLSFSVKGNNWEIDSVNQSRWWKTKRFVSEQWKDVFDKEKWKEESWKNALRTAVFVATGVWAISLLVWLWKRIFGKKDEVDDNEKKDEAEWTQKKKSRKEKREERRQKRKEKREGRSRWQKFLIWSAIAWWTVIWWVEIYKHWHKIKARVKEKLWLALSFDDAMIKVENEVRNWKINEDGFWAFNAHFEDGITFNEEMQEICSYDEKTKINKKDKKLEGLDVEFSSYEELIHASNIVNFAKRKLKWRWASETPFIQTQWWWDIAFNCSASWSNEFLSANNSKEWSWILGTLGTVWWWLLWSYCGWVKWAAIWSLSWWLSWYALWAYIDNTSSAWRCCWTIAKWKNFDLFLNYLNGQKDENWKSLWMWSDQNIEPEDKNPIQKYLNSIITEIENSYWNWEEDSGRRNLQIEFNENNPEKIFISSYWHKTCLTLKWCTAKQWEIGVDFSKITKIHIEKYHENDWGDWLDIDFPHNEAWLKEAIRTINLTNKIREDRSYKWWEDYPFAYGRYKIPFWLDMDTKWLWENHMWWVEILSHSVLEDLFPTIADDLEKYNTVSWSFQNQQNERNDEAKQDKSTWSQYIKFLHQITWWTGQKWYWKNNS